VATARSLLDWLGFRSDTAPFGETTVVVSPHLDDAVFSLGASLCRAARQGMNVTVLTVLAGNPDSSESAGWWDAQAGFRTAGEANTARRQEDARACSILGVIPRWLSFEESQYGRSPDNEVVAGLDSELQHAGLILLPGSPLAHPDHKWVNGLVLERLRPKNRVMLYLEQPYALWQDHRAPAGWRPASATLPDRVRKLRACRSYTSQLTIMGRKLPGQLTRFEAARGGEFVGEAH